MRCSQPTNRTPEKWAPHTLQHGATWCNMLLCDSHNRSSHSTCCRSRRTGTAHCSVSSSPKGRTVKHTRYARERAVCIHSAASRSIQCLGYPPRLRPLLPAMPMRAVLNPPWPDSEPVEYCILHVARCDRAHASSGLESLKDLYRAAPRPRPGVVTPFTAAVGSGTKNTQPPQLFLTLAVSSQRRRPCLSPDRSA